MTSTLLGFILAKFPSRFGEIFFIAIIASMAVPFDIYVLPLFRLLLHVQKTTGVPMLNTYWGMVFPWLVYPFGTFLMRQAMLSVPDELLDAARIDGLSEHAIVWRIAFPIAWPAASAFAVFSVVAHWNDLFWPLIVVSDPALATPPRGILYFRDEEAGSDFGPLMAAATMVTAPLILGFLLAQRKFIQGITASGLKG